MFNIAANNTFFKLRNNNECDFLQKIYPTQYYLILKTGKSLNKKNPIMLLSKIM